MTAALEGGEWSAACPGQTLPSGKTRYPLNRRLGGPQGRSEWVENLAQPGFDPRIVQPVVSHYTDWATRPTIINVIILQIYVTTVKQIAISLNRGIGACFCFKATLSSVQIPKPMYCYKRNISLGILLRIQCVFDISESKVSHRLATINLLKPSGVFTYPHI